MSIIGTGSQGVIELPARADFSGGHSFSAEPQTAVLRESEPAFADTTISGPPSDFGVDDAPDGTVTLDMERLVRSGRVVPPDARSSQAEEFRHMKRQLLKNTRSKEAAASRFSLIMVTSALPGEGKTFCAISLALSMAAEIDTSVLLVDADVVRPDVMNRLGVQAGRGLLDVLAEPTLSLTDVILQTNVPKLSLLPAGTRNVMSTELLASRAMETLLLSLASGGPDRVVIFDAPPLLLTNEAKVLASRIGQVLLVVEAAKTPRSAVGHALAAVEQCPVVMSVLNKAHHSTTPYGYGQYKS